MMNRHPAPWKLVNSVEGDVTLLDGPGDEIVSLVGPLKDLGQGLVEMANHFAAVEQEIDAEQVFGVASLDAPAEPEPGDLPDGGYPAMRQDLLYARMREVFALLQTVLTGQHRLDTDGTLDKLSEAIDHMLQPDEQLDEYQMAEIQQWIRYGWTFYSGMTSQGLDQVFPLKSFATAWPRLLSTASQLVDWHGSGFTLRACLDDAAERLDDAFACASENVYC